MRITADNLKRKHACQKGIAWYVKRGFDKVNIDQFTELDTDEHEEWYIWFAENMPCRIVRVNNYRFEHDEHGNRTSETYPERGTHK